MQCNDGLFPPSFDAQWLEKLGEMLATVHCIKLGLIIALEHNTIVFRALTNKYKLLNVELPLTFLWLIYRHTLLLETQRKSVIFWHISKVKDTFGFYTHILLLIPWPFLVVKVHLALTVRGFCSYLHCHHVEWDFCVVFFDLWVKLRIQVQLWTGEDLPDMR